MLEFYSNNTKVISFPGQKLTFEQNSPAFSFLEWKGDASYPISFPLNAENKRTFEFPHKNPENKRFPITVKDSKINIITGTFIVKNVSDDSISGHIKGSISVFFDEFNTLLNDFDFGGDLETQFSRSPNAVTFNNDFNIYKNYPLNGIHLRARFPWEYIPCKNPGIYPDVNSAFENYYLNAYQYFINAYSPVPIGADWGATNFGFYYVLNNPNYINTVSPHIDHLTKTIFNKLGYSFAGDFYDNLDFWKIVVLSLNAQPYGINLAKSFSNDQTVGDFLKMLINKFGLGFYVNHASKEVRADFNKDIIDFNNVEDWTNIAHPKSSIEIEQKSGYTINEGVDGNDQYQKDFSLAESDFDYLLPEVQNFSDLAAITGAQNNDICYVVNDEKYYSYDEPNTQWNFRAYPSDKIELGDGDEEINSNAQIPQNSVNEFYEVEFGNSLFNVGPKVFYFPTPNVNQNINNQRVNKDGKRDTYTGNKFGFKLLFFHGLRTTPLTGYYVIPFASGSNYLPDGTKNAAFSLFNDGDEGTYNTFWKPFLDKVGDIKPRPYKVLLKPTDYFNIDYRSLKKIGNEYFILKKVKTSFPISDYSDVELVKISPKQNTIPTNNPVL